MQISLEKYGCSEIFDERELCVLNRISTNQVSLYKLTKCTNIPLATLWRIVNKLEEKKLITHRKRGIYDITWKGALTLYLSDIEKYKNVALYSLSKIFNIHNINELDTIMQELIKVTRENGICILNLENLKPALILSLFKAIKTNISYPVEFMKFIVNNLLPELPVVKLNECEVSISFLGEKPIILAGKCKRKGEVLNSYCEHLAFLRPYGLYMLNYAIKR